MTAAEDVLRDAKGALKTIEDQIRNHPYFAELDTGRVPIEALRALPGHQYHMWASDMRSAAKTVTRFGDRPYVGFFTGFLRGEMAAHDGVIALGGGLGMTVEDLEAYEPTAEGFAFAAYVAWLAMYGSAAEVACGLAVNLAAWGHNCGQVSEALRNHYGLSRDDTAFLDAFAAIPSRDDDALEIIEDDLGRGVTPQRIITSARLIQGYEKMFWDTMARIANEQMARE